MTEDLNAKTETVPVAPVSVAIIGSTGNGTGDGTPMKSMLVETPGRFPNVALQVVSPIVAIFVREANIFLTTLLGLLGASMTPAGNEVLAAHDFTHLVYKCASLSVAAAGVGLLKDLITIFSKLEGKWPLWTGNI